jgi:hypothetical protein
MAPILTWCTGRWGLASRVRHNAGEQNPRPPTAPTKKWEFGSIAKGIKTQFTGEVPRVFYRGMSFFSREVPTQSAPSSAKGIFCEGVGSPVPFRGPAPGDQYMAEESLSAASLTQTN